jgi:hypothetical protein
LTNCQFYGHPSTPHLWWAWRPLAACRAVLFASLVDDPDSDPAYRKADGTVDEDRAGLKRADLFNFIEDRWGQDRWGQVDRWRPPGSDLKPKFAGRLEPSID